MGKPDGPEVPPEEKAVGEFSGWLSGLIKPDPEPLPPRPTDADSFSQSGIWLAGLADRQSSDAPALYPEGEAVTPQAPSAEGLRRQLRRVTPIPLESSTGAVGLDSMMGKAQGAGFSTLRLPGPPLDPPNAFAPPSRPAWAKPEGPLEDVDVAAPAWVKRLQADASAGPSAAPLPTASPPPFPPARAPRAAAATDDRPGDEVDRPGIKPSRPSTLQVDRVVTSVPKRSLLQSWSASVQRQRVSFYRSLTTMLGAGLPMFSVFEFLARQAESPEQRQACRRIAQDLVMGHALHKAAYREPVLFSEMAVKLVEVGLRSGKLVAVLQRLAMDEEHRWRLRQTLQSHLMYPVCIASITLVAVVLLPPLVLADLLTQVVSLTSEPPALTKAILWFSNSLSSPLFLTTAAIMAALCVMALKSQSIRDRLVALEPWAWEIPGLGALIRSAVTLRFLRVFAMTYEVGLTAPQCLILAAEATGSRKAILAGPRMKKLLIEGGTLRESLEIGDFLPRLVVEAVEAGQQSGEVAGMMENVAGIVDSELEYRIEGLMAFIEPLFMAALGIFVGVFAVGCLLPILKLSESL